MFFRLDNRCFANWKKKGKSNLYFILILLACDVKYIVIVFRKHVVVNLLHQKKV